MYSYRIEQAIRAAAVLHKDQVRKGAVPLPYITHLVAVSMILFDYTEEEDVIVAALLHDTLEDTDYTEPELREDFGERVGEIVRALSEPTRTEDGTKLTWAERKHAYSDQLQHAPAAALLVAAADKTHNMRTIVEEYYEDHERFRREFGGELASRLELYHGIADVLNNRLENAILHEFNHVFSEYKSFIHDVQASTTQPTHEK